MTDNDRDLGMDRPISRRDFLNGVAVVTAGALVPGCAHREAEALFEGGAGAKGAYPPLRTGLRGSHPGSFEVAHELAQGGRRDWGAIHEDDSALYDLIVVGAGISGLSAAYFFRQQAGPKARILVLDCHDDFGGHATRNEFHHNGRLLLAQGGCVNIEDFSAYGNAAQALVRELGIEVERYSEFLDEDLYRSRNLRRGRFFDRETFGSDRLVVGERDLPWEEFLAMTPLSEAVRKDIVRLYEGHIDYLPDLSLPEKEDRLRKMGYQHFLLDVAKVDPGVIPYFSLPGYWAVGIEALPAWIAMDDGYPGFQGLGFPKKEGRRESRQSRQYFQFPDGNASMTRLMVRAMVPQVAPGSTMEDIVTAPFDYAKLDQEDAPVRIRLNSTGVRVRHLGDPQTSKELEVTYIRGGKAQRVRARDCILACNNSIIPHLCPELPERQNQALSHALKSVHLSTRVLIRNWESFAKLGLREATCLGSYHHGVNLSPPISIGKYRCSGSPEEPMVLQLSRVPLSPGLPVPELFKAARWDLLSTSFETVERKTRDQLGRVLAEGGFDPARDIEAITVNRWAHGYAYGYDPAEGTLTYRPNGWPMNEWPEEKCNWIVGRKRFGRISIANADAAGWAMAEAAMGEAHRAVQEVIGEAS